MFAATSGAREADGGDMALTETELRSLEELARVRLGDESRLAVRAQLERIIEFVRQLREIDAPPPPAGEAGARGPSALRDDRTEPCLAREDVLAAAPEPFRGMFKVPPVIDTGER
jgi:aspartyl/glutamyl-tRNA(Asn/Gln) amidotransferase C subunit